MVWYYVCNGLLLPKQAGTLQDEMKQGKDKKQAIEQTEKNVAKTKDGSKMDNVKVTGYSSCR